MTQKNGSQSSDHVLRAECVTFDCENEATRVATFGGDPYKTGEYCDDCALILWRGGDEIIPPFPMAEVVRLENLGR